MLYWLHKCATNYSFKFDEKLIKGSNSWINCSLRAVATALEVLAKCCDKRDEFLSKLEAKAKA